MTNNIQPTIKTAKTLNLKNVKKQVFSNGLPYYVLNAGKQELVKIDFLFEAGTVYNENPLIAEITNSLLEAGTKTKTSEEIAEELDFYGAFLELDISKHHSIVSLYTLNKYFLTTIKIVKDVIFNSVFPEHEIEVFLQNKLQRYKINRQKTEVVSQELFVKELFGSTHPYGKNVTEDNLKDVSKEMIKEFYTERYKLENLKILISGNVKEEHIITLENFFGKQKLYKTENIKITFPEKEKASKKIFSEINGAMQSSIKIGLKTINKHHPDYFNLNITSIILGGYFGSRLMTNIREDKGYTYGIQSVNMSIKDVGLFIISAASGKEVYKKAIVEIYKELNILRTELVPEQELQIVKNYLSGSLSKMFDGVFSKSNVFLSLIPYDLNFDYYHKYFEAIKSITPQIILETAKKYLIEDEMIEIVVGAK